MIQILKVLFHLMHTSVRLIHYGQDTVNISYNLLLASTVYIVNFKWNFLNKLAVRDFETTLSKMKQPY